MKSVTHFVLVVFACAFLVGCASTRTQVAEKGRNLKEVRSYFVLRNLKDNHGIDVRIVRALQARGFQAESGPITLLPATAQVVITYEDRWAWDFSTHMVYLKLGARDPRGVFPYITASYTKQIAFSTQVDRVIDGVLGELLAAGDR